MSAKKYWEPATYRRGKLLPDVSVVYATAMLKLNDYPPSTRAYVRAQSLHSGAKDTLFDYDEHRITARLTISPYYVIPELERRLQARVRCENSINSPRHSGFNKLPYWEYAANQARTLLAALAMILLAWMQLVAMPLGTRQEAQAMVVLTVQHRRETGAQRHANTVAGL
ncbi:transposase [Arthrobacter sp. AG1021]|uniref:transposase n=1 Tax=Arthrobacter sp. AG1021 TaxID=2183908 RepID=UPI000EAD9920|nr:transposase [Arthrobacter sp. AG1021]